MKFVLLLLTVFCFSISNLVAQNSSIEQKSYDKNGLKFNYLSDWEVIDKSSPESLNLYITKPGTSNLIILNSPNEEIVSGSQYLNLQRDADTKFSQIISRNLSNSGNKVKEEGLCIEYKARRISGKKFSGYYQNEPAVSELYHFAVENRFVVLVYYRADKDSAAGNLFWKDFVGSLSFVPSQKKVNLEWTQTDTMQGGIINQKAIELVKPKYPSSLSQVRIRGTVEVIVEINEKGKVVKAKAISGNPNFYNEAESAAKRSKFAPTILCDKAVGLNGTIIYNFAP
jgi:TonB family protein